MVVNKKKELAKTILCWPYTLFHYFFRLRTSLKNYCSGKTYFSEYKKKCCLKNFFSIFVDAISGNNWIDFYKLYGFDRKTGVSKKDYVGEKVFWKTSDKLNGLIKGDHTSCQCGSQLYLLRNKLDFYRYMTLFGLPVPRLYFVIVNGQFYDLNMNKMTQNQLQTFKDFFLKDIDGQCASFVKRFRDCSELHEYKRTLENGVFIAQERVIQKDELNFINPHSINTLRIVTVYNNGNPCVFSSVLRVGTKASGDVDNWAAGGLSIGINESGSLRKFGFYKHSSKQIQGKTDRHPDTGLVFDGYKISDFKIACEKAIEAHKLFYGVHSIGWDIALTDAGPVFIEGNDNWEISLLQASNGGLYKKFKILF